MDNYHKRKRDADDDAGGEVDLSLLEALESSSPANGGDAGAGEVLDLRAAKRLLLSFERRLRDNLEARMKHPDDPSRFADSELALHAETERLRLLAGAPELFPDLLPLGLASSLSSLLSHDNADLAAAAASLLADLTDPDSPSDLAGVEALADALVAHNALDLLVHNLSRLSESDPDEADAVHSTLAVVENLVDLRPAVADLVCERTKLLRWLLARIKTREFDANKQYASEILAILLQNSPANQKRLGQMNGVDGLLQAVAMYKSRDPKSSDEEEMLENLFDCLCCLLMPVENKERFVKAEGVELMIIIMKQKKSAYGSAIRALDFAMTRFLSACERFVDVLGLKTAFAAFMGKIPVNKKNKKESYQEELEERIISLIASLFGGISKGSRRIRLLGKFVENECEKIDRLMEFYMRYSDRVKTETEKLDSLELDDLEMDEDERYNRKLEAGLYTLQLIAVILGHIWHSGNSQMKTRIELLLRQNKLTKQNVKDILQEICPVLNKGLSMVLSLSLFPSMIGERIMRSHEEAVTKQVQAVTALAKKLCQFTATPIPPPSPPTSSPFMPVPAGPMTGMPDGVYPSPSFTPLPTYPVINVPPFPHFDTFQQLLQFPDPPTIAKISAAQVTPRPVQPLQGIARTTPVPCPYLTHMGVLWHVRGSNDRAQGKHWGRPTSAQARAQAPSSAVCSLDNQWPCQ